MKTKLRKTLGFTLVELLVVISIIAVLAGTAYPVFLSMGKAGDKTKAISNGKQVYMALKGFEQKDFPSFPDDRTAEMLEEGDTMRILNPGPLTGDTSNPYFRQVLAAGCVDDEGIFFAKYQLASGEGTAEPNREMANGQTLTRGECGFGYIMFDKGDTKSGIRSGSATTTPVVITPVSEGGNAVGATYDVDAFNGTVIVFRNNGAAESKEINNDGTCPQVFPKNPRTGEDVASKYFILAPEL